MLINIEGLIPHPRNDYFFDVISGANWDRFLKSIETSGVIQPIVITNNNVVVSGNQRIRACKVLGITQIEAVKRTYDNDDSLIKDLIETNLRQRGIGNTNPVKFGRCILELERIYGIRNGSFGKVSLEDKNCLLKSDPRTEQQFADQLGISLTSLKNYKKLAELIPEIEDFLDTGMISASTALAITRQLSMDDQAALILSTVGPYPYL